MTDPTPDTDQLALFAVKDIQSGMTVGLGTGQAASRGIRALAHRVSSESLDVTCVSTSVRTTELAESLGLNVVDLEDAGPIDLLFDGADEVDEHLVMLKGRGGAMTREKIIAHAADRRIYLVQKSKFVSRIGQTGPVPVEVLPYAGGAVLEAMADYGLDAELRMGEDGQPFRTDDGGMIVLVGAPEEMTESMDGLLELSLGIKHIPGVVEHGLFIEEADAVLVEGESGEELELYVREDADGFTQDENEG